MECVDVSADVKTTGEVLIGQVTESVFELCDNPAGLDEDWFEVMVDYGKTYLFFMGYEGTPAGIQPTISLKDRSGNDVDYLDDQGALHVRFTARYTGRFYVATTQGSLQFQTPYTITAVEINDDNKSTGPTIGLRDGFGKLDEIEIVGDTDTFNFDVFAGRDYRFIVVGNNGGYTLSAPSLELSRDDVLIGSGAQVITHSSAVRETLQLTVGGNMGTGTYQVIGLVEDEVGQDANTTSELEFDSDGLATKLGYITEFGDFDWHKVELNSGDLVKVTLRGNDVDYLATPNLIFRDTGQEVVFSSGVRVPSDDAKVEFYYHAQTAGTHYAAVRSKLDSYNGAYEISVEKTRTPISSNYLFGRGETTRLLLEDSSTIPIASLVDLKQLEPFAYQVYSAVPLNRDGVEMYPGNVYGIIANQIDLWSVDPTMIGDDGDVMVRAIVSGEWSQWQEFNTVSTSVPEGLLSTETWEGTDPITFRFVDALPAYYTPGEFGDFVGISQFFGIGSAITAAFEDFSKITGRQIEAAADGVEADINIFATTALGAPFLSYLPGAQRGGDMIFDVNDLPSGDLTNLQQFRMLRAMGPALGLDFTDLSRRDSVMGSQTIPNDLMPQNFGATDWLAFRQTYGSALLDPNDQFSDFLNFTLTPEPTFSTVGFEGRNIVVGIDSASDDFVIDLRDGQRSFAKDSNVVASEVVVAYGAQVLNAIGADGDDTIYGNGLKNVLQGGPGADFLIGNENADTLIGGLGGDIYIHYFGDGDDLISDSDGVDTLCFFGRGPFEIDDLFSDYLFSREGNFLDISLTLDGGGEEGSVRIDTGFGGAGIVESLELWQGDEFRHRISLFDLWSDLSDGQTSRFIMTGESDSFGNLVAPA